MISDHKADNNETVVNTLNDNDLEVQNNIKAQGKRG